MKLNEKIEIYNGDCLKVLDELYQSNIKVDLILTDLPTLWQNTKSLG